MLKSGFIIFLGSGLGGAARFFLSGAVNRWMKAHALPALIPWGTLAVNVAGCFLIGGVYGLAERGAPLPPAAKLLLTTGFCGGLTTFSTFSYENLLLLQAGHTGAFLAYTLASLATGLVAAWLGHALTA